MTFFQFFLMALLLYQANPENPSQLHFGKKCLSSDNAVVYSYIWVTKPNEPLLPISEDQCPKEVDESHAEHEPVLKPKPKPTYPKGK